MNKISFHSADRTFYFNEKKKLKQWIIDYFNSEKKQLDSLSYIFCSDDYLLNINRQFLQHHYYTDIITFDLSETKDSVTGEVYISLDRVKDNAQQLQIPFKKELLRVMIHGVLHLCGYKDKSPFQQKQMRAKENEQLIKFNFNVPRVTLKS